MSGTNTSTLLAVGFALALWGDGAWSHEGHDHGAEATAISVPAAPRAEAATELYELVALARSGELIIYLDRFTSNEPIAGAAILVETPVGSVDARALQDGTYQVAAPWAGQPGRYDLIFTVTKDENADVLPLTLVIPGPTAEKPTGSSWFTTSALASGVKDRIVGTDLTVIATTIGAFLAGMLAMAFARRRRKRIAAGLFLALAAILTNSVASAHEGEDHSHQTPTAVTGRDTAQRLPEGGVFVPKSAQRILAIRTLVTEPAVHRRTVELPGRIIPDPGSSGYVQASVGGRLTAPNGGFPRLGTPVKKGDVLAYVTPPMQAIDVSDMRQRQGELDQQISIVERRLARYERLAPSGAIAQTLLEETRLELQGLNERRASLDKVRRDSEALIAPVDGVIAEGTPVAGQMTQPNSVVFHIVDPARLWVEALSYEALAEVQNATARIGGKALNLSFRGSGFADRNQSIPIHFAIEGHTSGLRAGQFVTVLATTDEEQRGIAVPRNALVRSANGQDVVFEHVAAERFEARPVRVEPLDGQSVLIAAGIDPGKRVVVQGAELLDQIR
jgi:RND family efflux transporter MFP subunit